MREVPESFSRSKYRRSGLLGDLELIEEPTPASPYPSGDPWIQNGHEITIHVSCGGPSNVTQRSKGLPIHRGRFGHAQVAKPEVYVSHFERMTGSSSGFNQTVKEIGEAVVVSFFFSVSFRQVSGCDRGTPTTSMESAPHRM